MSAARELALLAAFAKRLKSLQTAFADLSKQSGPAGRDGVNGIDGRNGIDGARGPQGDRGPQGLRGPQGEKGDTGPQGDRGPQGEKGDTGEPGPQGEKGDTGTAPAHEWQGTRLRFRKPDGKWGRLIDLAGGQILVAGGGGGGTLDLSAFPAASNDIPNEFLVRQQGKWVRATYGQMLTWFPSGSDLDRAVLVDGVHVTVDGNVVTD